MYEEIIEYIKTGKNKERLKKDIRKKFKLSGTQFKSIEDHMTWEYPIYEDDSGKILGILDKGIIIF